MNNRLKTTTVILFLALFFLGISPGRAFAGKSWSDQFFSKEHGIAVIGNDDKFSTVFGISLKDKRKLWQTPVAKSRNVSINIDGQTVYLVASEDMGFEDNIVAHELTGQKKIWSEKIKKFTRKTPVITDEKALYFGAELPFRDITVTKVFAVGKNDGKMLWKPFEISGFFVDMIEDNNGNFVLFYKAVSRNRKEREKSAGENLSIVLINRSNGEKVWEKTVEGKLAYKPRKAQGVLSFVVRKTDSGGIVDQVEVVSEQDGQTRWIYTLPAGATCFSEPVFVEDRLIILTATGSLLSVKGDDASKTGQLQWEYQTGDTPSAAPMLKDGRIVTVASGIVDKKAISKVASVNPENGEKQWEQVFEGTPESPVNLIENLLVVGIPQMETTGEGKDLKKTYKLRLIALNIENGEIKWETVENGRIESLITIDEGKVFAFLYDKVEKEIKGKMVETPAHKMICVTLENGAKLWAYENEGSINTEFQVVAGNILIGTQDGFIISVSPQDGKERFKYFIGNENELDSSVVTEGNLMGFATQNGNYFIIDDQGKPVSRMMMKPLFAMHKFSIFIGCLMLSAAILWYIYHARRGRQMFIRKIAGLSAIDEAVGRSTEMGKPVLYITGLADVEDIQTLASLSIMGHIATKTAEYDTPLIVPCCRSVVMSTAQEVCKESYLKAGRPETFRRENIHYLTDDQFGYVAGVDGIMMREKPAANFYMGKFYAESLILAETGHSTGAIQIAGTAEASQLPFFVAACDYTLIGEELLAASAYLSNDSLQIGSLKGQDIAKAIILLTIILGCVLLTFDIDWIKLLFTSS